MFLSMIKRKTSNCRWAEPAMVPSAGCRTKATGLAATIAMQRRSRPAVDPRELNVQFTQGSPA